MFQRSKLAKDQYIVAIDLGHVMSVCSVSQAGTHREPRQVQILAPPSGVDRPDRKILTAIAFDRDGKVAGLGCNARERYCTHPDSLCLFEKFKMCLKELGKAGRRTLVKATDGTPGRLMHVIAKTLECFKDEVLEYIKGHKGKAIGPYDVKWVLTVPAIWSDQAKAFMREAAYEAGMTPSPGSDNLALCWEPEGACISAHFESGFLSDFGVGAKFMVVDAGGGTVDITVHCIESLDPLELSSIIVPRGNDWGSATIDREFCNFLRQLLGQEKYNKLSNTAFFQAELCAHQFEIKKMSFDRQPNHEVYIDLSNIILQGTLSVADLQSKVVEYNRARGATEADPWVTASGSKLMLWPRLMKSFFEPALQQAVQLVQEVLSDMPGCDKILLVGGFGESRLLRQRMGEAFPHVTIRTPEYPSLATVRGALHAAIENSMTTRKAKYTYAVAYSEAFNPRNKRHQPVAKKTYKAKRLRTEQDYVDLLLPMVERGTNIPVGHMSPRTTLWPLLPTQTEIALRFYGVDADMNDVLYPCARDRLGVVTVQVDTSRPFAQRSVDVQLEFDTEIRPRVFVHGTNTRIDDNMVSLTMVSRAEGGDDDGSDHDDDEAEEEEEAGQNDKVAAVVVAGDSSGALVRSAVP